MLKRYEWSGYCKQFFYMVFQLRLTTLDLAGNRITRIQNISHLVELQEFWVITDSTVKFFSVLVYLCYLTLGILVLLLSLLF